MLLRAAGHYNRSPRVLVGDNRKVLPRSRKEVGRHQLDGPGEVVVAKPMLLLLSQLHHLARLTGTDCVHYVLPFLTLGGYSSSVAAVQVG